MSVRSKSVSAEGHNPVRWDHQRERGALLLMRALRWIAVHLGRGVSRLCLAPLTLYFLATSASTRRVSRQYLARVLGREPGWTEVARHVHTFASVALDRVFLLTGTHQFNVVSSPTEDIQAMVRSRGTLLFLAHLGSFEVLRVGAVSRLGLPVRVVLDRDVGRRFIGLLTELDPQLGASIIDSSNRGVQHVLAIRDALAARNLVGMMADRARVDERTVTVNFLGGEARFPAGPWIIAATLNAPVVLAFGVYRGGDRYDLQFEMFAERIELPRSQREEALRGYVQRFADRLAHHARSAPCNWFNFYDFWAAK